MNKLFEIPFSVDHLSNNGWMPDKEKPIYRRHFAFAYVLLVAVIFCGCGSNNSQQQKEPLNKVQEIEYGTIQVLVTDSCEYVVWNYSYAGGIVHKQNCKFCAERRTDY